MKPAEISEIITHLAFYSGWANAMAAIAVTKDVFAERNIETDKLPAASPALLPLNEAAEADRAKRVGDQFGAMFPGVVQYTTDVLFRDLWLRPDLAPRDRSLVTISALIANGQVAQLTGHIPIGMNNGLTQPEIAEAITHLAFYVGWPNVFSAMPVAKEVLKSAPADFRGVLPASPGRATKGAGARMFRLLLRAFVITLGLIGPAMAQERILISSDWGKVTAELVDNNATRSLVQMLPLTIEMRDHLRQEKTGNLPSPLPAVERQLDFSTGTLGLWSSNHFVIYYRDGRVPQPGIILLGRVTDDVSIFDRPGPVTVRVERIK